MQSLRMQSPGHTYSRRYLESSQSLSQVKSTRAFSRADLIPYLNVSRSYVVAAGVESVTRRRQTASISSQRYISAGRQVLGLIRKSVYGRQNVGNTAN